MEYLPEQSQMIMIINIQIICDYNFDFTSFVQCYEDEIQKLDRTRRSGERVLLNIESFSQGHALVDTFSYTIGEGIESLRAQFEKNLLLEW